VKYLVLPLILCSQLASAASLFSDEAYYNAQQAAYIQVGLAAFVGDFQKYGERKMFSLAVSTGTDRILSPFVFGYKVYREQSVTLPWDNKRIRLAPYNISLELPI
jgi:hypothetical protein